MVYRYLALDRESLYLAMGESFVIEDSVSG